MKIHREGNFRHQLFTQTDFPFHALSRQNVYVSLAWFLLVV